MLIEPTIRRVASHYPDTIVSFGIILENTYLDVACHRPFDEDEYPHPMWDQDKYDQLAWWYDQWLTTHPGVVNCDHGMSLQGCMDPISHYDRSYD